MPLIFILMLMLLLPGRAQAQIDIVFSGAHPVVRAGVGPLVLSARIGARGIDVHAGARRTTVPVSRSPRTGSRTRAARANAGAVLATADSYIGTPYVWGGETPAGFDCSGFVQYVFRAHGIELPRTSRQQAQVGQVVALTLDALQPGDLMFFATDGVRIDHVAIYAGGDDIIQSSSSGGGVGYDQLSSRRGRWFADHHVATRRVLSDGRSLVGPLTAALRAFVQFDPPDHAPKR